MSESFGSSMRNVLGGLEFVQQGVAEGTERKKQSALAGLAGQFYGQQSPLLGQIAQVDPRAASQMSGQQSEFDTAKHKKLGRLAAYLAAAPAAMRPQIYSQIAPQFNAEGLPVPETWDEGILPLVQQYAQAWGMGDDASKPMNVSPGGEIVDPRTGRVIHSNTNFAPPKPVYDASRGMYVTGPDSPQGPGAVQVAPARPDYEAQRLSIAQQAAASAASAAKDAAEARRRATFGTAPAGQRFNDQGTLEPIPGYSPAASAKPIPPAALRLLNEEREKVQTSENINANIDKWMGWLDEGELPLGLIDAPVSAARNWAGYSTPGSANYQSFKAGLEKMRNDSLRLNSGVQTEGDAQRSWKELLDNINDEGVVKQRLGEIRELNERARLLHQSNVEMTFQNYGHEPDGRRPGAAAAPAATIAEGSVAKNPKTGEMIIRRNGQWVPHQ